MNKSLTDQELEYLAQIIKDKIFVPRNQKRVTIFLCGADIKNAKTARAQMATILSNYPRYEVLYPEDLFDDLLAGQGQHSLLKLEEILADCVDVIVLFPESPGSLVEIGAFSNNEQLARKMIVLSDKRYKSNKSFINYGPYRLIKSSKTGKVMHINYEHLTIPNENQRIYRNVNNHIATIRREHPVKKDVANILEAENFILPCIYLLDKLNNGILSKLIGFATKQEKVLCDIATKSSLGRLAFKKYISRIATGYQVTPLGADYVRNTFDNIYLDKVRIEVLNAENRRNAQVRYARMTSSTHP